MNRYGVDELGRAMFEESGDALFLLDPDSDRLLRVNATAERLSGFSRAELLAHPLTHWVHVSGEGKGGGARLRQAGQRSGVFHSQEGYLLRTPHEGVWIPV